MVLSLTVKHWINIKMNLMICRINSLIIRMDDYDEFSDNSIEIVLNQF